MLHFERNFKASPNAIKSLHKDLQRKLRHFEPEIRDCIEMTAWELLENGVKYHEHKHLKETLDFSLEIDNSIRITMGNQVLDQVDTEEVIEIIRRINLSPDKQGLYLRRLGEIMANRVRGQSKLGLLKVACEGGFYLSYKSIGNRLYIIAEKDYLAKEKASMDPLQFEDLKINITEDKLAVNIEWLGRSRSLNPEKMLDKYLEDLRVQLVGRKVIVDFTKLEAMNSSTVPPLLTFLRGLEEQNIPSFFIFNDAEHWQKASFIPLSVLTNTFKFVKIKGSSLVAKPFSNLFSK